MSLNGNRIREQGSGRVIMKIRSSIMAAAAVVLLGGTGALALPAVAGAHSATTTLKFTAVRSKVVSWLDINSFAYKETDRDSTGAVVGFDVVYFQNQSCCSVSANVAFAIKGGLLYGSFDWSGGPITNGKVTGGTGVFQGVTGTITGTTNDLTRIRFTITYS
jgi:hypothetical protein